MDVSNPKPGLSNDQNSDLSIDADQVIDNPLLTPAKDQRTDGRIGAMKISTKSKPTSVNVSIDDWNEFMKQNREILKLLNRKRKRSVSESDDENASTRKTMRENVSSKSVHPANVLAVESDDEDAFDYDQELDDLADDDIPADEVFHDDLENLSQEYDQSEGYGPKVADRIASMTKKMATAMPEDTLKRIEETYKLPSNCNFISVPKVNTELWSALYRPAKTTDLKMQKVQRNLTKIAAVEIAQVEASLGDRVALKRAVDGLGLILRTIREISQDRRVSVTSCLDAKYKRLNSKDIPITEWLFGDDFQNDVKKIDTSSKLGKGFGKSNKGRKFFPNKSEESKNGQRKPDYRARLQQFAYKGRGRGRMQGKAAQNQPQNQNSTMKA